MQRWIVICGALLALVFADDCPTGGACEDGHTCCSTPADGYDCCPLNQAECCEDHVHCCPEGTLCVVNESSCVNATASIPWVERVSANPPRLSKSFRMIKPQTGENDDNICPDESRCPSEFSCLKGLTRFGCCPLSQGVSCPDGKHCCPEGHRCSADCRSCVKEDPVGAVMCGDGVSECPEETTCCETPDGSWGCCPMPKAVCCEDKAHCCPEGSTCDVAHSKCISPSTKKETPMWAKFAARKRADWENGEEGAQVTAPAISENGHSEKVPDFTTETTVLPFEEEVTTSLVATADSNNVPCNDSVACEDGTTCCKTKAGGWSCCPLPQAVCCEDLEHCCPHGKKCNLVTMTCDDPLTSVPWLEKIPTIPRVGEDAEDVPCDSTHSCPDGTTCCKVESGDWACCPLPKAVCCPDHLHCCPENTTCDPTTDTCHGPAGPVPMVVKQSAFSIVALDTIEATTQSQLTSTLQLQTEQNDGKDDGNEEGRIQCDPHAAATCPQGTTCCFMTSSQRWGCCPLPKAVCCAGGDHCCPSSYKCDVAATSCVKGEVVIPWYNKLPATDGVQDAPGSVECDAKSRCPEDSTCCQLSTGQWGCCPLHKAVCCADMEHCCPQGYSCNMGSGSCQKLIMLQLQTVPLTRVYIPKLQPELYDSQEKDIPCQGQFHCRGGETCCKTSSTTWGCCPILNAVCCGDMKHCCPAGYACGNGGTCTQNTGLRWDNWQMFFSNKKRVLTV
ncbi:granulin a [Polymixia lowei]